MLKRQETLYGDEAGLTHMELKDDSPPRAGMFSGRRGEEDRRSGGGREREGGRRPGTLERWDHQTVVRR